MQKKKLEVYHEHEEHHIDRSIAIIGSGNMGSALLKGIIHAKLAPPKKITACDINEAKLKILANEWKIKTTTDIQAAVQASDIVLLCVKPQTLSKALQAIKSVIRSDQLVISIVAGMRIAYIQQMLGERIAIVRTMPNIAATVDEGAAALAFGEHVSPAQQKIAISIFEAVGDVVTVSEEQLDAVTGLSGSGPAYIYMVIEALIDGGVKMDCRGKFPRNFPSRPCSDPQHS
jgi:pyrroline-5-carboxylate reductase